MTREEKEQKSKPAFGKTNKGRLLAALGTKPCAEMGIM